MRLTTLAPVITLTLGLLAVPFAAAAPLARTRAMVGVLSPSAPAPAPGPSGVLGGFLQGLRELGYQEGDNLLLEYRYAERKYDRLPALATDLVRHTPDVIYTYSTPGARAAKQATTTIPIVIGAADDLVQQGLVADLAHPGGNITGVTLFGSQLEGKRLELLKQAVSHITRVAVLVNPNNTSQHRYPSAFEAEARALGVQLQRVEADAPEGFDGAFAAMQEHRADALMIANDSLFYAQRQRLAALARQHRLPTVSERREFVAEGGFLAYGPNLFEMGRRAAAYVDKILKGNKPADLPVEQPAAFELVINLKTAQELGLTIPPTLLFQATEVIQ